MSIESQQGPCATVLGEDLDSTVRCRLLINRFDYIIVVPSGITKPARDTNPHKWV